jgi:hypothetical protein
VARSSFKVLDLSPISSVGWLGFGALLGIAENSAVRSRLENETGLGCAEEEGFDVASSLPQSFQF